MIDFLLFLSAVLNIFLVWYVVKLLRLEKFYGDATLKNLLVHSKNVAEECKQFQSFLTGQEDDDDA